MLRTNGCGQTARSVRLFFLKEETMAKQEATKEASNNMLMRIARQLLSGEMDNIIAKYPRPAKRWAQYGSKEVFIEFVLDVVEIGKGMNLCPNLVEMLMNADDETKGELFDVFCTKAKEFVPKERKTEEKDQSEPAAEKEN